MASIPTRAVERLQQALKRFQPILASAKARDVNESDTVVIVTDLLQEAFGYDKYSEITSEHMIRSTYCDLAVKLDGNLAFLLEVKAIGLELKDQHVKQAVDYAANKGVEWVGLTNGVTWRIHKVIFAKPIDHEVVVEFDLLQLNHKDEHHIELLGLLTKEGWQKARIGEYHTYRQALSKFSLGALLLSETMLAMLRREVRKISPGLRVDIDQLEQALRADVIKRDVLEGEKAAAAQKSLARAQRKAKRSSQATAGGAPPADATSTLEPTQ